MNPARASYFYQAKVRERNRAIILKILEDGPKRFTDLKNLTNFSPRGLTTILNDLREDKKIHKILYKEKEAYELTKKGLTSLHEITKIGFVSDGIEEAGGKYYHDYSTTWGEMMFCRLPWGIQDDLVLDKRIGEKLNPFSKQFLTDLQGFIFEKIRDVVKRKKINLDQSTKGEIILAFTIDYKEFVESINQNSLEYFKNISKEELKLLEMMEEGPLTDKEFEMFEKIRKRTRSKIQESTRK